jgi:hypothetical protein
LSSARWMFESYLAKQFQGSAPMACLLAGSGLECGGENGRRRGQTHA